MKITKPTRVMFDGNTGTITGYGIEGEADHDYIFSYDNKCKGHDGLDDTYQLFEGVIRVPMGYYFVDAYEIKLIKDLSVKRQIADLEEQIKLLKHIPKIGEIVIVWNDPMEKILGILTEIDGHYQVANRWYENVVRYDPNVSVERQLK